MGGVLNYDTFTEMASTKFKNSKEVLNFVLAGIYSKKKETSAVIEKIIAGEEMFIGDHEQDPDMFYFNIGSGQDGVTFSINQKTGVVEVTYSDPDNEEDNEWFKSGFAENIIYHLQKNVFESAKGGKKNRRKNSNLRKNTRRNKTRFN